MDISYTQIPDYGELKNVFIGPSGDSNKPVVRKCKEYIEHENSPIKKKKIYELYKSSKQQVLVKKTKTELIFLLLNKELKKTYLIEKFDITSPRNGFRMFEENNYFFFWSGVGNTLYFDHAIKGDGESECSVFRTIIDLKSMEILEYELYVASKIQISKSVGHAGMVMIYIPSE